MTNVRSIQLLFVFAWSMLLGMVPVHTSHAQLISPGKLSQAHTSLEGVSACVKCHKLGERGTANALCLDCHQPLAARLARKSGYHAGVADRNCAECHKEHFGLDFQVVRLDTLTFDHGDTGYVLEGKHRETACASCHRAERISADDVLAFKAEHEALDHTYLGLPTTCDVCHVTDNPHQDQFAGRACDDCHTQVEWDAGLTFDHADTRFPLTGRHQQVDCARCHPTAGAGENTWVRYAGVRFDRCTACHDDAHQGAMASACTACHNTGSWHEVSQAALSTRFDHSRTGFALKGRHATLDCTACHARSSPHTETIAVTFQAGTEARTYPLPQVTDCRSCHVDAHDGAFTGARGGATCDNCHTEAGWLPTTFDIGRHNRDTDFALAGGHLATPCVACHAGEDGGMKTGVFHFDDTQCATCHEVDSPHGNQFAADEQNTTCTRCHVVQGWSDLSSFDHQQTRFVLTGRHVMAACTGCHLEQASAEGDSVRVFRGTATACADCHAKDDPHTGQFADAPCSQCHDTEAFHLSSFDHQKTRFPLDGAHRRVACAACHPMEQAPEGRSFRRFKPLGTACADCH